MPRVSVNIVCHNEGAHLAACIESVRSQDFEDWEIVLVDDGSDDTTPRVIESMARREARLRPLSIDHAGIAAARNTALAHSRGEYIALLDASDLSAPHRLARQVAYLDRHPGVGVVGSQMLWFTDDPAAALQLMRYPETTAAINACFDRGRMGIAHATCMARRGTFEDAGGYDESLPRAVDLHLFLRVRRRVRLAALPDALYYYRRPQPDDYAGFLRLRRCHRYALRCAEPGQRAMNWFPAYCASCEDAPLRRAAYLAADTLRYLKNRRRTRGLFRRAAR